MLVDCGLNWGPSLRALGRALKATGVPPGGLEILLLTHRHPDHSGGAGPVHERWGGRVLAHPTEIAHRFPGPEEMTAWMTFHGADPETATRANGPRREKAEVLPPRLEPLDMDRPLSLGDLAFELIHAPGHAPGQVMLREPGRGWLLTADHVLTVLAWTSRRT